MYGYRFYRSGESQSLDNVTVLVHVRCADTHDVGIDFTYTLPCLWITPGIRRTP